MQLPRVITGDHCAFRLDNQGDVGVAVDELVEVGLVVSLVFVEFVGLFDILLHVGLDRIHQELFLGLSLLQDVADEESSVLDETGRAESTCRACISAILEFLL